MANTFHENHGFIQAGLALASPHAVDLFELETKMTEDAGKDFITRKRMPVEFAIPDDVGQAAPASTERGKGSGARKGVRTRSAERGQDPNRQLSGNPGSCPARPTQSAPASAESGGPGAGGGSGPDDTLNPPVGQHERIAKLLDTLVMGRVARREFQALDDGEGGDHRVAAADGPADSIQVARDLPRQVGGGLVKQKHVLRRDRRCGRKARMRVVAPTRWYPWITSITETTESVR